MDYLDFDLDIQHTQGNQYGVMYGRRPAKRKRP